ncbi:MAG: hypothetical protein ACK5YJ_00980 [Curvibacter sp.]|jgi:hypothetical protein
MRTSTLALTLLALSVAADAQTKECEANFHRSGGLLSGTTYKTVASIPGTTAAEALSRVHAFTAESGFAVTSIDRASGVIAAVNSGSTSNRPYNLNIVIADVPGSEARITLTYSLPAGAASPDNAVRDHFCKTIVAAGSGTAAMGVPATAGTQAAKPIVPGFPTPPGFAQASSAQAEHISRLLDSAPEGAVRQAVLEAKDNIANVVRLLSCQLRPEGSRAFAVYTAPGAGFANMYTAPSFRMRYHPRGECVDVVRFQGWTMPARNALQFEVVYMSKQSGESARTGHELVRQPDGLWLFNR